MNAPLQLDQFTPEDLLRAEESGYELLDGRLVEKPMGAKAGLIASALIYQLHGHVRQQRLGYVFDGEGGGYELFPGRPRVRKPDVSFIARARLEAEAVPNGWLKLPPDFVCEIVSPNDHADELMSKVREWLTVGVRLVWVIYPDSRTVLVLRAEGVAAWFGMGGTLSGEEVVPGFTCPVDALFADLAP